MATTAAARSRSPSLQDARKAFTRAHICNAAKELFFMNGYASTTFDQIAAEAGTRRTTLYSHFRDKAEILQAIGDEYHEGLRSLVDELPGPVPSRAEIEAWIARLVDYVVRERAPATLLIGLGIGRDKPMPIDAWSRGFLSALAQRIPAFAKAASPDPGSQLAAAWARVVLRELSLGCLEAASDPDADCALLAVVADLFERFVTDFR